MHVSSVRRDIVQPVTTQFIGHVALASRIMLFHFPSTSQPAHTSEVW